MKRISKRNKKIIIFKIILSTLILVKILNKDKKTSFNHINQEKMSKSIGNIINIRDALEKWDFNLLRIFFLSHHYRTPVDLSEERLIEIEKSIKKIIK